MTISKSSVAVLVIQLAIVSSIAGKYLYQRWTCPRVWTRTTSFDPELLMRGRYLSLQLMVDGCQSTMPSAADAVMPRNLEGVPTGAKFSIRQALQVEFPARLIVKDNKLLAIRLPESDESTHGQMVEAPPGNSCDDMHLADNVDFYIAESAVIPPGKNRPREFWVEVTVPPKGPPRPIQLALKEDGVWKPLAFQ